MQVPKKYFQDRVVLLLTSLSVFLTLFGSFIILLRLGSGRSDDFITEYRANQPLHESFQRGGSIEILSFIVFAVMVLVFHALLSMKVYPLRRHFATTILGLGLLLLVIGIIVANALLEMR